MENKSLICLYVYSKDITKKDGTQVLRKDGTPARKFIYKNPKTENYEEIIQSKKSKENDKIVLNAGTDYRIYIESLDDIFNSKNENGYPVNFLMKIARFEVLKTFNKKA